MFFIVHHLIWQEWTSDFPFLRFYVIPCRKSIFLFSNHKLQLWSRQPDGIFSCGLCNRPWNCRFSRIKSISAASSSMVYLWISWKRKCVFQFSIALPLDVVLPSTRQRLLCEAQETEVPSLLTKVTLVAECDRMWILLEHCVCRRWQRTWDLIKIYLEGDHSSTRPNLEKWLSSTWQT